MIQVRKDRKKKKRKNIYEKFVHLVYKQRDCYGNFLANLQKKKINLAVTGCMGRMGKQIIKSAKVDKNFKIVSLTENRKINKKIAGIKIDLNTEQAFKNANVIIDFTVPKCTFQVLKIASKFKKKYVI